MKYSRGQSVRVCALTTLRYRYPCKIFKTASPCPSIVSEPREGFGPAGTERLGVDAGHSLERLFIILYTWVLIDYYYYNCHYYHDHRPYLTLQLWSTRTSRLVDS